MCEMFTCDFVLSRCQKSRNSRENEDQRQQHCMCTQHRVAS